MASAASSNNELLVQLRSLTDPSLDESTGIFFLEMCEGNVETAAMFYKEQMQASGGGAAASGDEAHPPTSDISRNVSSGTAVTSTTGITKANSAGGRRRARATVEQIPADLDQSHNSSHQNILMNSSYNNGSFSGDIMAAAAASPNGNGTRKMPPRKDSRGASNNVTGPVMEPGGGPVMARRDRGFANNVDLLGGTHAAEYAPFFDQGMASLNLEDAFMGPGAYNETATHAGLVTRTRLNSSYGSHNNSFNNSGNLNNYQANDRHNSAPAIVSYDPKHYREPGQTSPLHRPKVSINRLETMNRSESNNSDTLCRRLSTISALSEITDYNDNEEDERGDCGDGDLKPRGSYGGIPALHKMGAKQLSNASTLTSTVQGFDEEEDSKIAAVARKPDLQRGTVDMPWSLEGNEDEQETERTSLVSNSTPSLPRIYQKVPPIGSDKDSKYGKGKRTPASKPGAVCIDVSVHEPGHDSFSKTVVVTGKLGTSETTQALTAQSGKHSKVRRAPAIAPGVVRVTGGEHSHTASASERQEKRTSMDSQEVMNKSAPSLEPNSKIRRSPATQPGAVNVSSPTESEEPSRPSPTSMQTNELNDTKPRRRSPMATQPGVVHVTEPGNSALQNSISSMNNDVDVGIKPRRRSPMATQPGVVHVTEPGDSALQNAASSMPDTSHNSEKRRVAPATMPGAVRVTAEEPVNNSLHAATPALDNIRNSHDTISTEKAMRHSAPAQRPGAVSVSADNTEDPRSKKEKTKGRGLGQRQQPEEVHLSVPSSGSGVKGSSKDSKFPNLNAKQPGAVSVTSSSDEDVIAKDKKLERRGRKKSSSPNASPEADDAGETNAINNDPSLEVALDEAQVETASSAIPTVLPLPLAGRSRSPHRRTEGRARSPVRAKSPIRDSPIGFPLAPALQHEHPLASAPVVKKKKGFFSKLIKSKK